MTKKGKTKAKIYQKKRLSAHAVETIFADLSKTSIAVPPGSDEASFIDGNNEKAASLRTVGLGNPVEKEFETREKLSSLAEGIKQIAQHVKIK